MFLSGGVQVVDFQREKILRALNIFALGWLFVPLVGLLRVVLRGTFRARAYIYRGVAGENKPLHL